MFKNPQATVSNLSLWSKRFKEFISRFVTKTKYWLILTFIGLEAENSWKMVWDINVYYPGIYLPLKKQEIEIFKQGSVARPNEHLLELELETFRF